MDDFRRQFLSEAIAALDNLRQNLHEKKSTAETIKSEFFRVLHTVKGTAQTFNFAAISRLAHALETDLSEGEITGRQLSENIEILQKSLTDGVLSIATRTPENSPIDSSAVASPKALTDDNSAEMPPEIYLQLSNREKKIAGDATRDGKYLTFLAIEFDSASFARELIDFRTHLSSAAEIIAAFPGANGSVRNRIGFRFLTASLEKLETASQKTPFEIVWSFSPEKLIESIDVILGEVVRHGEQIAFALGKKTAIEIQIERAEFSRDELKIIFESLLHLVRNAVDHAFEKAGKIAIEIKVNGTAIQISVADDGRGINLQRIRAAAIEKNLIAADENLTDAETRNLIFQPGISTKNQVSEISGRGIGLDAVRHSIEKFGGQISVADAKVTGVIFEIVLPRKSNQV